MSSGMTVSTVLLHAVCLLCSQSASSVIAACLVLRVSDFMAFSEGQQLLPSLCYTGLLLPAGSAEGCWSCVWVAHRLEYSWVTLPASRLGGACSVCVE